MINSKCQINFCWVPGHVGIPGNEQADRAAKAALVLIPVNMKLHYTDFKPLIIKFLKSQWQNIWNNCANNKLYSIKTDIGEWYPSYRENRRDEVVLARLRLGHSYITHSYLLKREDQPVCIPCQEPFTIHHLLLQCTDLQPTRERFYNNVTSLKCLFENVPIHTILNYLKAVNLFNKI